MRTTLTIDDDVAVELDRIRRTRNEPLKALVNRVLRAGLAVLESRTGERPPVYRTKPVSLGKSRLPNIDDVSEVLAFAEGEDHK